MIQRWKRRKIEHFMTGFLKSLSKLEDGIQEKIYKNQWTLYSAIKKLSESGDC